MHLILNNYKILFASFEKSIVLYENGESFLFIRSKDSIPQIWSSNGAINQFTPFLIGYDENVILIILYK